MQRMLENKNVQELKDFSEEQQAVELLMNTITTQKNSRGSPRTQHSIKIQGYVNFRTGSFL